MDIFRPFGGRLLTALTFFLCSSICFAFEAVPGEFIVRYKPKVSSFGVSSKAVVRHDVKLKRAWQGINTFHYKSNRNNDDKTVYESLKSDPDVLSVEPNYIVKAFDLPFHATSAPIKAPESWASGFTNPTGKATIVAILDSGLAVNHPLFNGTGRLWQNDAEANGTPGVDDDGNGYVDDINGWNFLDNNNNLSDTSGHGTHVAGIILGSSEDISTFNPSAAARVKIMPLKFLNSEGVGTTSSAINAIYYAISKGAKVLNNSWGGPGYSASLHEAIVHSFFQNTLFVAAAGNSNSDNDSNPIYPASYDVPNVLAIGASTDADNRAFFSNYGSKSVDLFAPGVNITSSSPQGDISTLSSGTSMAAPFAAGAAALMAFEAPHFSGFQLKRDLMASADSKAGLSGVSVSGARLNFSNAVSLAQTNSGQATFNPDYTPKYLSSSRSLSSVEGSGGGCGRVKALYKSQNNKMSGGGSSGLSLMGVVILFLLTLPLVLNRLLKNRAYTRRFERKKVNLKAKLYANNQVYDVRVKSLSQGGLGVDFEAQKLPDFKNTDFRVEVLNEGHQTVVFKCKKVSSYKSFMGFSFES